MVVDVNAIILAAKEGAAAFNAFMQKLPKKEVKMLEKFFVFRQKYVEEISRADADHDDLLKWREEKNLFVDTFMGEIKLPGDR